MKKTILITVFLILGCVAGAFAERPFLVVAEDWPPFEFKQKDGKIVGIDIDIARHIFGKMGIDVKFLILPWNTAWKMVEGGRADAVLSTSRKEARNQYLYYPEEDMWKGEFVFFVNKKKRKPAFNSYEDAKGLKVAIVKGNTYHLDFMNAGLSLKAVGSLKKQFRQLASGKVDLALIEKKIGLYSLRLWNMQKTIGYYDHVFYSKGYPMPFVKKSTYPDIKKVADQFERELKKLKASGEYDRIKNRWVK